MHRERITMIRKGLISLALGLAVSSAANAEWVTNAQDDIFSGGQKAMLIGAIDPYHTLVFDCDSNGLFMSLLEKGKWEKGMELASYRLLVKVDRGEVYDFAARGSQRNDLYTQASVSDKTEILKLLGEIRDAQQQVQIGMQIKEFGAEWSGTASVAGSTREANRFLNACKL